MSRRSLNQAGAAAVIRGFLAYEQREGRLGRAGPVSNDLRLRIQERLNVRGANYSESQDRAILDQMISEQRRAGNAAQRLRDRRDAGGVADIPCSENSPGTARRPIEYTVLLETAAGGDGYGGGMPVVITSATPLSMDQVEARALNAAPGVRGGTSRDALYPEIDDERFTSARLVSVERRC